MRGYRESQEIGNCLINTLKMALNLRNKKYYMASLDGLTFLSMLLSTALNVFPCTYEWRWQLFLCRPRQPPAERWPWGAVMSHNFYFVSGLVNKLLKCNGFQKKLNFLNFWKFFKFFVTVKKYVPFLKGLFKKRVMNIQDFFCNCLNFFLSLFMQSKTMF